LTFNGLHGIISHKIELFITTTVRTSNPTQYPARSQQMSEMLHLIMHTWLVNAHILMLKFLDRNRVNLKLEFQNFKPCFLLWDI
jgi:hypothetical protein